jgi:hypothetical protein
VLRGAGLPPGWVGKVHACHQLTARATAPLLLHLDADVSLAPDGLLRMLSLLATPAQGPAGLSAALVTAVPRQRTGSLAERLMMPLLHLSYAAWLPLQLIHLVSDPRVLAANGQLLLVRRGALDAVGGWARVRAAVVDDMALCRAVKESGQRVVFADGDQMATCRMYEDAGALWRGFSKNFYEGIGGRPFALILVIALHIGLFVLPYGGLAVALAGGAPDLALAAGVGVAANVLLRAVLALRHHHGPLSVALHPIAVLGMMAVLLNSAWWSRKGAIQWRGRSYAARAAREAA